MRLNETGKTPLATPVISEAEASISLSQWNPWTYQEKDLQIVNNPLVSLARFPGRLERAQFLPIAYRAMFLSRVLEEILVDLYHKGYVKGTVALGRGNEATATAIGLSLRPGWDVVSLLHRDLAAHLLLGTSPYQVFCQYMANAESPTKGHEGNVHYGDAPRRRLPMISHLGKMLSLVVGGTWAARQAGENCLGLAIIGDGGSSTGEFHEALNIASVHNVPVLFVIENNRYAFSTPISAQYHCEFLSDRAKAYGITGQTIDGTDPWLVYTTIQEFFGLMERDPAPAILECMTLRLCGHAVYDKCEYVSKEEWAAWEAQDPVPRVRRQLLEEGLAQEEELVAFEAWVRKELQQICLRALRVPPARPSGKSGWPVFATSTPGTKLPPFKAQKVKNGSAVTLALDYILKHDPKAFLVGLDIGRYGSAFKTCKGLIDRYGPSRVIDMPIGESGIMGFALGAAQVGAKPIMEFQFADFSTESTTQLGLNAATWFFRSGSPMPILVRMPCGGGLTMGAFHSAELEGLWARFPGLKVLYPATAQEIFEALVAGFFDPNPCVVFEHKLLYWSKSGDIDFNGELDNIWRPRKYLDGDAVTVVAFGAMVHEVLTAVGQVGIAAEVWNPFVLQPLAIEPVVESVRRTGRLVVVQESPRAQGLGDRIISLICQIDPSVFRVPPVLVASPDAPVPFAPELESHYRPNAQRIGEALQAVVTP
ncbi:MAG: thiamine pyrophosphate-dependent enzyme [Thermoguttaceae bacterium]|nr:thiamine pyrophosphate-dependent enzyme [Thermoguttaceae bacterium]MDW8079529.1 thiamine pyrophosphate-dependent enzyme [Thermoguttaceae bacterium]